MGDGRIEWLEDWKGRGDVAGKKKRLGAVASVEAKLGAVRLGNRQQQILYCYSYCLARLEVIFLLKSGPVDLSPGGRVGVRPCSHAAVSQPDQLAATVKVLPQHLRVLP